MGAGKSILIAELCYLARLSRNETIVVSTPRVSLVEQLSATIAQRCGEENVGRYYTHAHEADCQIVVACTDSLQKLAAEMTLRDLICPLWIADECHRTETRTAIEANEALKPERLIGFTATPYRAASRESLSLYEREVYTYGAADALRDGVVVPWRVVSWNGTRVSVDDACVDMCRRGAQIGPGVVNAMTIDDAVAFAEILCEAGVRAAPVHSKLSREQTTMRIEALERGDRDVLVHVSMLQEGIDLPWLRWLCLRRPVGSKVRFAQEVGRVLRAHVGKAAAVIYDPHDLFGTFKLEYEALLGMDFTEPEDDRPRAVREADTWAQQLELWLRSALAGEWVTPLDEVSAYLRELTCALEMGGHMERLVASKSWRYLPASSRQRQLMTELLRGAKKTHIQKVPVRHRRALRAASMCAVRGELKRGQASDLISVLMTIRQSRGWPSMEVGR
jgi:hypothetical protein